MKIGIYQGESLEKTIKSLGLEVLFVEKKITAQSVLYYFNLQNPNDRRKINNVIKDLEMFLHCNINIKNSKTSSFAIEIDRDEREFLDYENYHTILKDKKSSSVILGIDENNTAITYALDDMPHMLVAGTTGSGKSIFLRNIILSLCCYSYNLGLILIDPKKVEFAQFRRIPQLIHPIITECDEAEQILHSVCDEMDRRYSILAKNGYVNNNNNMFQKIVVVVDELADLMLTSKKTVETPLVRLAQKGRACGIHLILATQRPTVNVVTGLLKANIPTRIAFAMASVRDSVVMLDHKGGEKLLGKGDALVKLPDRIQDFRVQALYVKDETIEKAFENLPEYNNIKPKKHIFIMLKMILKDIWEWMKSYQFKKDTHKKTKHKNYYTIKKLNEFDAIL